MKTSLTRTPAHLRCCALAAILSGLTATSSARADERFLFGVEASAALPVSAPDTSLYGPGASGALSVAASFDDVVTTGLRLEGGALSDAPPPGNHLRDVGVGSWGAASLFLRMRPLVSVLPESRRSTGLYLELGVGGAISGDFVRPSFELGVGWGLAVGDVVLVPTLGVTHILSWEDPLDGIGAFVARAGLGLVFGDTPPATAEDATRADRDGDGIDDDDDFCPDEPEDLDTFEDGDGCPDRDDDQDGIDDVSDACRLEPEDFDGDADEDGCPEPDAPREAADRDRDGFADDVDHCPDEPEVVNGVDDDDGCPDEGLIVLVGDRVVLDDRILFDLDRAHVHRTARSILAAVVHMFESHPEWDRVRVEGHTDARGTDEHNLALSERRASAVLQALVALGIPLDRIETAGYGESRPREIDDTETALAQNRRVEIVMIDDVSIVTAPVPTLAPTETPADPDSDPDPDTGAALASIRGGL